MLPTRRRAVQIVPYDPEWPRRFEALCARIRPALDEVVIAIEHVGSTSVPGLAAKPVIDMDLVIRSGDQLPDAVERLSAIGYTWLGELGIQDRHAFRAIDGDPVHNLYVCPAASIALRNHLAFRDHLRAHGDDAAAYAELKRALAARFPHDVDRYAEAKTDFVLAILGRYGLPPDNLDLIRKQNEAEDRKP